MIFDRIYFDRTNSRFNLIMLMVWPTSILIGIFHPFSSITEAQYMWLKALGYLLMIFQFGKRFILPNYVGWNSLGINIKIRSFLGKSFKFEDIRSVSQSDKKLQLRQKNGDYTELDLAKVKKKDVGRLIGIITEHS